MANSTGDLIYSIDGLSVTLRCPPGSIATGAKVAYCNGTHWNRALGNCRPIGPATSLDFEAVDLGGWKSSFSVYANRWQPRQSMRGSVPRNDHTIGWPFEGTYLVTQVQNQIKQSVVEFVSPLFNATLSRNACFRLWYCTNGQQVGRLRVNVRVASLKTEQLLFESNGTQINSWQEVVSAINEVDEEFYIIIQALRSKNTLYSDIAIDDIALLQGADCQNNGSTVVDVQTPTNHLTTTITTSPQIILPTSISNSDNEISTISTSAMERDSTATELQISTKIITSTTHRPPIIIKSNATKSSERIIVASTTMRPPQTDAVLTLVAGNKILTMPIFLDIFS